MACDARACRQRRGPQTQGREEPPAQLALERLPPAFSPINPSIAIDDATRLAYAEVLLDEKATTAIGFLRRAVAFYKRHGMTVEELITDNGAAYISRDRLPSHGIRHLRTRPRRPQTNGKAERFIRTMLAGWAYGAIYASSAQRTAALDGWLWRYNHHRRHAGIGRQTR